MRRLLLTLALAWGPAPALAQGTEVEPQAAPGSIGYGMIENASAEGVFELVHDGHVTVRHVGSGLVCHFEDDGDGRLILYPSNLPRGDDVACEQRTGGEFTILYATRYPFNSTLQEQIAGAEAAIRQRFADAAPYPGAVEHVADDGLPLRRSTRFIVTREGQRYFTRASVARVGSWIIKLRYNVRAPDDAAAARADQAADALFDATLREILSPPRT
jgi:hypothetical protein